MPEATHGRSSEEREHNDEDSPRKEKTNRGVRSKLTLLFFFLSVVFFFVLARMELVIICMLRGLWYSLKPLACFFLPYLHSKLEDSTTVPFLQSHHRTLLSSSLFLIYRPKAASIFSCTGTWGKSGFSKGSFKKSSNSMVSSVPSTVSNPTIEEGKPGARRIWLSTSFSVLRRIAAATP